MGQSGLEKRKWRRDGKSVQQVILGESVAGQEKQHS